MSCFGNPINSYYPLISLHKNKYFENENYLLVVRREGGHPILAVAKQNRRNAKKCFNVQYKLCLMSNLLLKM